MRSPGRCSIVPATREARPPRLDPIGTLVSVVALAAIVFGTIEGPERGWGDPVTLAALLGGLAGIALFVVWELNRREPMLDPRNFLRRGFGAGSLSISVQFFALFGFLFLALPFLQLVLGYSPLEAALALLPMAAVVIPLSRIAPKIAGRVGVRVTGPIGLGLMATGLVILSSLDGGSSYWHFLVGVIPFGAGMALAGAPATTAIVASLPREKQGVASAINDVSRELGGALGIAILGSVLNSAYRSSVADQTSRPAAGARRPGPGVARRGPGDRRLVSVRRTSSRRPTKRSFTASASLCSVVRRCSSQARSSLPYERPAASSRRRTPVETPFRRSRPRPEGHLQAESGA